MNPSMDATGSARRRWNGAKNNSKLELAQPNLFNLEALDRAAAEGAGPCQDDERYTDEKDLEWARRIAGVVDGFTLDVAACEAGHCAPSFFGIKENGLLQPWSGDVWCNPPYSDIEPWCAKAWTEWRRRENAGPGIRSISMLLPATRTEQPWWQRYVEPYRDQGRVLSVHFLPGRPRFRRPGSGPLSAPPFGCVLLVWRDRTCTTSAQAVPTSIRR